MTMLNIILVAFLFATIFIVLLSHKVRILRLQTKLERLIASMDSYIYINTHAHIDIYNKLRKLKAFQSPSNTQGHSHDFSPVPPTLN